VSDEGAKRMLANFKPSQHVKMVWRVADVSATSRTCRTRGILRTTRQRGKREALPDKRDIHVSRYKDVVSVSTRMLQGCYEETAPVEFRLNSANPVQFSRCFVLIRRQGDGDVTFLVIGGHDSDVTISMLWSDMTYYVKWEIGKILLPSFV